MDDRFVAAPEATARKIAIEEIGLVEPLWLELHKYHVELMPTLAGLPARSPQDSWERRRKMYESWLAEDSGFVVVAEIENRPVGYGATRITEGLSVWETGDRVAVGESLSILPEARGKKVAVAIGAVAFAEFERLGIVEVMGRTVEGNDRGRGFFTGRGGTAINTVLFYRLNAWHESREGIE
jgi:GNAT superfamily N-acetyltransferase